MKYILVFCISLLTFLTLSMDFLRKAKDSNAKINGLLLIKSGDQIRVKVLFFIL